MMETLARTPHQIGTAIQRVRKQRGWTQSQLAERAGLRQETISIIENGEKASRIPSILRVLAALDLELTIQSRSRGHEDDIEALF